MEPTQLLKRLTNLRDELTSLLLDLVPDGVSWEDAEPELDAARVEIFERIEQLQRK